MTPPITLPTLHRPSFRLTNTSSENTCMRFLTIGFLSLGLAATSFTADNQLTDAEKTGGWKLLFDGSATTGWVTRGKKELTNWKAIDGSLTREDRGGDALYDAEQFENFILSLDWKVADKGNSGVFIRLSSLQDWVNTGAEIQILDLNETGEMGRPTHIAGSLYDLVAPPDGVRMKPGEWNHFEITCAGPKISTTMNGVQTFAIDVSEEKWQKPQGKFNKPYGTLPRKGYLMLQDHGKMVEFKNIKLKPLP
jgi:hypothetical protein